MSGTKRQGWFRRAKSTRDYILEIVTTGNNIYRLLQNLQEQVNRLRGEVAALKKGIEK